MVISDTIVVNVFDKKELTAGSWRKLVYTEFIVLFTQCSLNSLGGRHSFSLCVLSRKDIVSKYTIVNITLNPKYPSLKCSFEHKNSLIQG